MSKTISNILSVAEFEKHTINKRNIKGLILIYCNKLQEAIADYYLWTAPRTGVPLACSTTILGPSLLPTTRQPAKQTRKPKAEK